MALFALGAAAIGALGGSCVSVPLMTIGCDQTSSATVVNQVTNTVENAIDINSTNRVSNVTAIVQSVTVNILPGGVVNCGTFEVNQDAVLDAKIITDVTEQMTNDIKTNIIDLVNSSADALSQDSRNFLERALGTTATEAIANIKTTLTNIVNSTVTIDLVTEARNSASISQFIEFNVAGGLFSDTCVFDQRATLLFLSLIHI
mgnify:CR=1 FL=1